MEKLQEAQVDVEFEFGVITLFCWTIGSIFTFAGSSLFGVDIKLNGVQEITEEVDGGDVVSCAAFGIVKCIGISEEGKFWAVGKLTALWLAANVCSED